MCSGLTVCSGCSGCYGGPQLKGCAGLGGMAQKVVASGQHTACPSESSTQPQTLFAARGLSAACLTPSNAACRLHLCPAAVTPPSSAAPECVGRAVPEQCVLCSVCVRNVCAQAWHLALCVACCAMAAGAVLRGGNPLSWVVGLAAADRARYTGWGPWLGSMVHTAPSPVSSRLTMLLQQLCMPSLGGLGGGASMWRGPGLVLAA